MSQHCDGESDEDDKIRKERMGVEKCPSSELNRLYRPVCRDSSAFEGVSRLFGSLVVVFEETHQERSEKNR